MDNLKESKIGIVWKEELEELGDPGDQEYSCHEISGWTTWQMESHIERLYERCNALLRRLNEQEEIIIKMMVK